MRFAFFYCFSIAVLFLLLCGACAPFTPVVVPTATLPPPSASPAGLPAPTESATPTTAGQALFCVWDRTPTPGASQCTLPKGEARSQFCNRKVPYALVVLPAEDTYQVFSLGVVCTDAGVKNGSRLLTCTGSQSGFAVQVCNPACALDLSTPATVSAGLCPSGFNYLTDRNCCQAASTDRAGCVTLRFDIGTCGGVTCSKIKNAAACNVASGCAWMPANGIAPAHCGSK